MQGPRSRRDALIETASQLFQREGYHATGIDRILAECGCAKMTLYKHFRSKDELILAALRRRDEDFRNWFVREIERRGTTAHDRLLAIFEVLEQWFEEPSFAGCMFVNACAEFGDPDHPVHAAAAEHKRLMQSFVRRLAREAGAGQPEELADGLILLAEGAVSLTYVGGQADAAKRAHRAAAVLIQYALGQPAVTNA